MNEIQVSLSATEFLLIQELINPLETVLTPSHLSDTAVFESCGHDVTHAPHTETLGQSIAFHDGQIQGHEVLENVSADGGSCCQLRLKKWFNL